MNTNSISGCNSAAGERLARIEADYDPDNIRRLCHFALLLDNNEQPRIALRLAVLWGWADEMLYFQGEANRRGEPVEYIQRGQVVKVLHPEENDEIHPINMAVA